uniref:RNA binding motif protein 34 n=1 Tax=Anser cygnoides TaxID=8845 RepID=A0A8B9ELV3_ANSCY
MQGKRGAVDSSGKLVSVQFLNIDVCLVIALEANTMSLILLLHFSCPRNKIISLLFSCQESALEQADEEEEQKLFQSRVKRASRAIAKSGVNSETLKQLKKKNEAEEMIKNKRTVFVGNLPVNSTAQVREWILAAERMKRRKIHPKVKYINAYVVFKEECDAIKALKKNGTEIASGFHIRVDIASKNSLHDNKRSVFLGNLSYGNDDAVRDHFADCGDVVAVRIVRDRQTGMGKGFGYILFENTDAVHLALKLNDSDLMGRKVRVKRCVEKGKAPQRAPNQPRGPKDRARAASKTKGVSNNSFVGEKAVPSKKSTKTKRLKKSVTKKKVGKNK